MISVLFLTDGRVPRTIDDAIESARNNLQGALGAIIIDDSANPDYAAYLDEAYSSFRILHHSERLGLGGAVRSAWMAAMATPCKYVVHWEDDFVAHESIDLNAMGRLLDAQPHLAQLVLKRWPWSDAEKAVGGQIEVAPDEYDDCFSDDGDWVEHRTDGQSLHVFSFNPCLISRKAIEVALATAENFLEQGVTDALLRAGYRFGYWGRRQDPPTVEHISISRSAGYRW